MAGFSAGWDAGTVGGAGPEVGADKAVGVDAEVATAGAASFDGWDAVVVAGGLFDKVTSLRSPIADAWLRMIEVMRLLISWVAFLLRTPEDERIEGG